MTAAGIIADLLRTHSGIDLPVRLRLWDGMTPEQVRVWRLYLAGGALAFEEGRMGVDQILAVRKAR